MAKKIVEISGEAFARALEILAGGVALDPRDAKELQDIIANIRPVVVEDTPASDE